MFLSKEERAAIALQKREDEVASRKKLVEEEREARHKYLEKASLSSSHQEGRRYWAGRDGEREKHREETLQVKDKEKEMDAIKVSGQSVEV